MQALWGGMIIGLAVSLMLLFTGRVTGISGIIGGALKPKGHDFSWRVLFIAGLVCGGIIIKIFHPELFSFDAHLRIPDLIIAGLLVGFGTSLGNGCTSGHGVCGISRFSLRSILATMTFIAAGVLSVFLFSLIRGQL